MIWIPEGSFLMGSPAEEKGRYDREGPRHEVRLSGFWMSETPVTQAQYMAVMGDNPARFKSNRNNPVEQVSWNQAIEFCGKITKLSGRHYTLHTEAQWEYACRAGTDTEYSFGNDEKDLGKYAWFEANSNNQTQPVGQKDPNAWGLHDMHGNVWELCLDLYGKDKDARSLRGGSWGNLENDLRCSYRIYLNPGDRDYGVGFRVVRSQS